MMRNIGYKTIVQNANTLNVYASYNIYKYYKANNLYVCSYIENHIQTTLDF